MMSTAISAAQWAMLSDMPKRRLQQKGDLQNLGGWWRLRWQEDQRKPDGSVVRAWSPRVYIGKSEGAGRLTRKEAEREAWNVHLSKLDQNNVTPSSIATVNEFVYQHFMPEHVAMLKKAGRIHYDTMLKHVMPALGEYRLRDVKTDHVQRLVSKMLVDQYSVQTAKHAKNVVGAIFSYAEEKEWFSGRNPAKKVRLPEMRRKELHALTFQQARELLAALGSPSREMVLCALLTSMNVAELCGLQWKRVNLTAEWSTVDGEALAPWTLAVRRQFRLGEWTTVKEQTRKRDIKIVPMLATVLLEMSLREQFAGPDDPVFSSRNGTPLDSHNILNRTLKPIGKQLGMPWLGWHVFRRSTLTMADQLGMSTAERKALAGHGTTAMSEHYVQRGEPGRILELIAGGLTEKDKGSIQ